LILQRYYHNRFDNKKLQLVWNFEFLVI